MSRVHSFFMMSQESIRRPYIATSKDIDAQISKVEDDGEEEKRSETLIAQF